MNERTHLERSTDAVRSMQGAPIVEAGESSLVIFWVQGNRISDIQDLVEVHEALLTEWGFGIEDAMALIRSRSSAKIGAGLRLFAGCGGRVSITPLGLS